MRKIKKHTKAVESSAGMRGLMAKILLFIGGPVALGFIAIGLILTNSVGNKISSMSNTELETKAEHAAAQIDSYFAGYRNMTSGMAANSQIISLFETAATPEEISDSSDLPVIFQTLNNLQGEDSETVLGVWTADVDSSKLMQSGDYLSDDTFHVTERPWFIELDKAGKTIMTEPYEDIVTKKQIVSIVSPIFRPDSTEIIGVAGVDFTIEKLSEILSSYQLGKTGYYTLVTDAGRIIYHPNAEYINTDLTSVGLSENISDALLNGTAGMYQYTESNSEIQGYVVPVGDSGWVLAASMPMQEFESHFSEVRTTILTILGIVMAAVIVLLVLVARSVTAPLRELRRAADEIAQGNLDIHVDIRSKDETGHVAQAIEKTAERLRGYIAYINEITFVLQSMAHGDMRMTLQQDYVGDFAPVKEALLQISSSLSNTLSRIQIAAEQVDSGSAQISNAAQALAAGSTEQAGAVEQLSASIEEVSEKAVRNTEHAENAASLMERTERKVEESNQQMKDVLNAMQEISASSNEIGNIIKAIDDIAFQTNILALNAAVEAARAGAAGKGFAVVADEVRNLAARSAEAAKQTEHLIRASAESVDRGSKITQATATSLHEATEYTENVQQIITNLRSNSQEQAESIQQILEGVTQISSVVQSNAATAEESSASSEELSAQAGLLHSEVAHFTLADSKPALEETEKEPPEEPKSTPRTVVRNGKY